MWDDRLECQKCGLLVTQDDYPICETCLYWRQKLEEAWAEEKAWWDDIKERYGKHD